MTEVTEMTAEEAYKKFPFLKKLNKEDVIQLMGAMLLVALRGSKSNDSLLYGIKAILFE